MSLLESAFAQLNMIVFQRTGADTYQPLNPVQPWLGDIWPDLADKTGAPVALSERSPFLSNFFHDSETHWNDGTTAPLKSGPFLERAATGENTYALEATALSTSGESLLILTHLGMAFEEQSALLQLARENLLSQEALELEVSRRTRDIRERESEISGRLIYAAGYRDEETGSHIRRIGMYCAEMGRALGWSPLMVDDIQSAAPMHDIGKIGIPDAILKHPGKLDTAKFEIMKRHAEIGASILASSDTPMVRMAADIAGCHHERWDGEGYPRGLKGSNIPISARIVAIADVYDALVHARVYKPAFAESTALDMMRAASGTHFDPDLLALFLTNLPAMRHIRETIQDPTDS